MLKKFKPSPTARAVAPLPYYFNRAIQNYTTVWANLIDEFLRQNPLTIYDKKKVLLPDDIERLRLEDVKSYQLERKDTTKIARAVENSLKVIDNFCVVAAFGHAFAGGKIEKELLVELKKQFPNARDYSAIFNSLCANARQQFSKIDLDKMRAEAKNQLKELRAGRAILKRELQSAINLKYVLGAMQLGFENKKKRNRFFAMKKRAKALKQKNY